MTDLFDQYLPFLEGSPLLYTLVALSFLTLVSLFLNFVVKRILLYIVRRGIRMTPISDASEDLLDKCVSRLVNIVPATAFTNGIDFVPHLPERIAFLVRTVATSFIILTLAMAIAAAFNIVEAIYNRRPVAVSRPIRGYIQLIKLGIYLVAIILIVSTLIDRSPIYLLSGLGAMAAVLMLVFQDTLLSLVASIQIAANGIVKVGDWIEMPNQNADGIVIDLALHTVRVQNLDRTITTFPTRRLITDPFKNWRGMQDSGGRRIKRAVYIDQTSLHFLTPEEREAVGRIQIMKDYLAGKEKEIAEWNAGRGLKDGDPASSRGLTNIGVFRAYVDRYLWSHPEIVKDDTVLVRQMDPGPEGLPVEIYCFAATTNWNRYEDIQADLIEHLYAVMPMFGLYAFQQPSGRDYRLSLEEEKLK